MGYFARRGTICTLTPDGKRLETDTEIGLGAWFLCDIHSVFTLIFTFILCVYPCLSLLIKKCASFLDVQIKENLPKAVFYVNALINKYDAGAPSLFNRKRNYGQLDKTDLSACDAVPLEQYPLRCERV